MAAASALLAAALAAAAAAGVSRLVAWEEEGVLPDGSVGTLVPWDALEAAAAAGGQSAAEGAAVPVCRRRGREDCVPMVIPVRPVLRADDWVTVSRSMWV